jgi:type IV pilus assembly protein PilO
MEKFFDSLPYDSLTGVKLVHVISAVLGIGLVIGAAFYFTLYSATQEEIVKLEKKRGSLKITLKTYQRLVASKEEVTQALAMVAGNLDAMKSQLPKTSEMPDLLKRVADMGKSLGLQVLLFELNEGSVKDYYKEIPVSINFRGGIWKTLDFFDGMQNLLRLVDFEELEMDVKQVAILGGEGKAIKSVPMLHTQFTAKTFSYVEGAENIVSKNGKK